VRRPTHPVRPAGAADPAGAVPTEPAGFADWVRPHLPATARLAPAADRDDVVQEVLARAWTKRRQYDAARRHRAGLAARDHRRPGVWARKLCCGSEQASCSQPRVVVMRRVVLVDEAAPWSATSIASPRPPPCSAPPHGAAGAPRPSHARRTSPDPREPDEPVGPEDRSNEPDKPPADMRRDCPGFGRRRMFSFQPSSTKAGPYLRVIDELAHTHRYTITWSRRCPFPARSSSTSRGTALTQLPAGLELQDESKRGLDPAQLVEGEVPNARAKP
jgi:hypothetical protein